MIRECDVTKVFYTDEPMCVYGVAVSMTAVSGLDYLVDSLSEAHRLDRFSYVVDTSFANCEEFVRVYELGKNDTISILRETVCNVRSTPKSCWYKLHPTNRIVQSHRMAPVYEVYFDSPIWVQDSFYIGVSQHTFKQVYIDSLNVYKYLRSPITPLSRRVPLSDYNSSPYLPNNALISRDEDCVLWGTLREYGGNYLRTSCRMMWPIVDSTMVGVAPPSVAPPEVSVSPNPTTGRATVVSEHELSHIEIINTQGEFVGYHSVSGTRAELDLTRYPTGIYFLHIYTEGGTVSRRVSVVR